MKGTEFALVDDAHRRLRDINTVVVGVEVPLLGRYVDLAFIQGGVLTTIEFKLKDWRKGLRQAEDHLLGTDFAYICMPPRRLTKNLLGAADDIGVGISFFTPTGHWPFCIVVPARRSSVTWVVARNSVISFLTQLQPKSDSQSLELA